MCAWTAWGRSWVCPPAGPPACPCPVSAPARPTLLSSGQPAAREETSGGTMTNDKHSFCVCLHQNVIYLQWLLASVHVSVHRWYVTPYREFITHFIIYGCLPLKSALPMVSHPVVPSSNPPFWMSWVLAAAQLKAVNVRKNNVMVMLTPTTLSSGQLSVLQGFVIFMMDYTISSLTLLFITNVLFMLLI